MGPVSQLQLRELVFCANAREQEEGQGSPISRFLGHGVRSNIPNSVNRNVDWNFLMSIRASQHEKRVNKRKKFDVGSDDTAAHDVDLAVSETGIERELPRRSSRHRRLE